MNGFSMKSYPYTGISCFSLKTFQLSTHPGCFIVLKELSHVLRVRTRSSVPYASTFVNVCVLNNTIYMYTRHILAIACTVVTAFLDCIPSQNITLHGPRAHRLCSGTFNPHAFTVYVLQTNKIDLKFLWETNNLSQIFVGNKQSISNFCGKQTIYLKFLWETNNLSQIFVGNKQSISNFCGKQTIYIVSQLFPHKCLSTPSCMFTT